MFFAIIFLALSAACASIFPEWDWATVLLVSFAGTASLRLLLHFAGRRGKVTGQDAQP